MKKNLGLKHAHLTDEKYMLVDLFPFFVFFVFLFFVFFTLVEQVYDYLSIHTQERVIIEAKEAII